MTRTSTIAEVPREGRRTGPLVFVKVRHEIGREGLRCAPRSTTSSTATPKPGGAPPPARAGSRRRVDRAPRSCRDPVLLFRYSAPTFNGHRIHYDRSYVTRGRGIPGLIVHGPLIATLMVDLFLRNNPQAQVTSFRFRARRPVFDIHPFTVCGARRDGGAELWVRDHEGFVAMTAELETA